jgi:adenylate cyclase
MLLKYLFRSIRPLGVVLIFLFAFIFMFSSEIYYVLERGSLQRDLFEYADAFENRYYDFRMRKKLSETVIKSDEIVLVRIDDYSLSKLGVWPLNRKVYAELLKKLSNFGAKVAAFDVLFPEKAPETRQESPDEIFAQALVDFEKAGGKVILSYNILPPESEYKPTDEEVFHEFPVELYLSTLTSKLTSGSNMEVSPIAAYSYPIQEFVDTGVSLGFISAKEDSDGVFRKYQLVANPHKKENVYVGSLGLLAYENWKKPENTQNLIVDLRQGTLGERHAVIDVGGKSVEMNEHGQTKIRFVGGEDVFTNIPLYDLISADDKDPHFHKLLKGKLVFIGSTAEGAHDLRPTPLDAKTPGVYHHINVAHMLIHKYFFKNENQSLGISALFLFFSMILMMIIRRFHNAFFDAITIIVLIAGSYYADDIYFLPGGYELRLFSCYFCLISIYSWNTFLNFYEANKEKRQIRGTFARYVAPTVVDEMLKDPDNIQVGGTRKDITCLFSDVRDFTSISEGLSAQELANMMNIYMNQMTDLVFETKGTLDKYIGDAIVAIWGAPLPIGNHAECAVEAAVRMAEAMPGVNEYFRSKNLPEFHVGIGLNSGECSVGNMGSTRIFSYTALGDNMNLGARLEGLCKRYGTQILISEATLSRLDRDKFKTRPIDKVIVKGRTQPVGIFEVISSVHFLSRHPDTLQLYQTGWQFFLYQNFQGALDVFNQILTAYPDDKPSRRLRDLCEKYIADPSLVKEDFDVTTMTEK